MCYRLFNPSQMLTVYRYESPVVGVYYGHVAPTQLSVSYDDVGFLIIRTVEQPDAEINV